MGEEELYAHKLLVSNRTARTKQPALKMEMNHFSACQHGLQLTPNGVLSQLVFLLFLRSSTTLAATSSPRNQPRLRSSQSLLLSLRHLSSRLRPSQLLQLLLLRLQKNLLLNPRVTVT